MYGTRNLGFSAAAFVAPGGINNRRLVVMVSSLVSFLLGKNRVSCFDLHMHRSQSVLFPAVAGWFSLAIVSVVTFPVGTGVSAAVWAGCALWQS